MNLSMPPPPPSGMNVQQLLQLVLNKRKNQSTSTTSYNSDIIPMVRMCVSLEFHEADGTAQRSSGVVCEVSDGVTPGSFTLSVAFPSEAYVERDVSFPDIDNDTGIRFVTKSDGSIETGVVPKDWLLWVCADEMEQQPDANEDWRQPNACFPGSNGEDVTPFLLGNEESKTFTNFNDIKHAINWSKKYFGGSNGCGTGNGSGYNATATAGENGGPYVTVTKIAGAMKEATSKGQLIIDIRAHIKDKLAKTPENAPLVHDVDLDNIIVECLGSGISDVSAIMDKLTELCEMHRANNELVRNYIRKFEL